MEIRSGLFELSILSQVSAVVGCLLSGVPLYNAPIDACLRMRVVMGMCESVNVKDECKLD